MKRYNHFQTLLMAFYSKSVYRDVGQNWRGMGLLYLLLLALICCLAFSYRLSLLAEDGVTALQPFVAQLPVITIHKGAISIDKAEPYFIKNPKTDQVVLIIDTTGQYNSLDNTTAIALLTQNQLLIKHDQSVKNYDFSTSQDTVYTQERIGRYLQWFAYIILSIAGLFSLLVYWLFGLGETLLYAGLSKFFIHTNLTFKTLCRVAAVAATPAFILAACLAVFAVHFSYRWLVYVPLSIGYLIYGINANWDLEKDIERKSL